MKTQMEIVGAFDDAHRRLNAHGFSVRSNGNFALVFGGKLICTTDTVDGLKAFADALDFAAARASAKSNDKGEVAQC